MADLLPASAADVDTGVDARAIARQMRGQISGEVRDDPLTRHLYSSDASMYRIEPSAVVFPRRAEDVAAAVAISAAAGLPVTARGAGTSLAGQAIGPGVVIDFSRHMRGILELDPASATARVQPGVVQEQLNRAAAPHGLIFGADTSTANRATLGGMIGNNSSGTHSIVHGTTVDHVAALDVVLCDGSAARFQPLDEPGVSTRQLQATLEGRIYRELPAIVAAHDDVIRRDQPSAWRQSGGYRLDRLLSDLPGLDLARFLVGTEGTLALVTEADVGLIERPAAQAMAVGHFRSVREAIAATHDALSLGAAAVELMDRMILALSRTKHEFAQLSGLLSGEPGALLFVTFFGTSASEARDRARRLSMLWERHGHGYHTLLATEAAEQAAILKVRASSLGLLMAASRGARRPLAFVEDTAVDPTVLEPYVARFEQILASHGMQAGFYGHCSVGCLHIRPFVDLRQQSEIASMRTVAEEVLELVLEFGGINSSEHGDGLVRSPFNERFFGRDLYGAMQQVKQVFDPRGLLNPGKITGAEPMTANLRDTAIRTPAPLATRMSFTGVDSMFEAADRCMNIGACRKVATGTMCPSYMVTLDERHSTRGRANALALALSDPDPHRALADDRLHESLDLCLGCKACKSECPLSVDMASLKSEALAHRYDIHGVPIRARFFAAVRTMNRAGSALAPISNLASASRPARLLLKRTLGIATERPLPQFEREALPRWHRNRARTAPGASGDVVFLADSFTSFTETRVPRAAIELLEAAGMRVLLESRGCCGRASLSKGLVDQARTMAAATVDRLGDHASRGRPIVGCEPSCLLTLRDEYLDLLPGHPAARLVAERVVSITELLLEAVVDGSLTLAADSPLAGRRVVVHPHCHEKAVTGTSSTVELLRRVPGLDVVELDVGCCGMAGSFGFESEHYRISTEIAGLRLLPALADEPPSTLVAATGVSCRQQIRHLTSREVMHPVQLVRQALAA